MARIRYFGPAEVRIPGVGPVGQEWIPVPDHIAAEHDSREDLAAGWEVERDAEVVKLRTKNSKLKTDVDGGDA